MKPRQSEGVTRVLGHAHRAAGRYRHHFIHTEHLLLGLLRERTSATSLLEAQGHVRDDLRRACEARCKPGIHEVDPHVRLTPRVQHIMALAYEEAERLGHERLSTMHVLIGILEEPEGVGGDVLRKAGVKLEAVRAALEAAPPPAPEPSHHRHRSHSRPAPRPGLLRRILGN